jgi:hypothetical protein
MNDPEFDIFQEQGFTDYFGDPPVNGHIDATSSHWRRSPKKFDSGFYLGAFQSCAGLHPNWHQIHMRVL